MQYNVPVVENLSGTVVAINVGGAVIPTIMSLYLLVSRSLWVPGAIAIPIVAVVLHWLAEADRHAPSANGRKTGRAERT